MEKTGSVEPRRAGGARQACADAPVFLAHRSLVLSEIPVLEGRLPRVQPLQVFMCPRRGLSLEKIPGLEIFLAKCGRAATVLSVVSNGAVHREVHRSPRLSRWALGSGSGLLT